MSETEGNGCESDSLAPSSPSLSNSNENVRVEGAELEAPRQERGQEMTACTIDDLTEEGVQKEGSLKEAIRQEGTQQDDGHDGSDGQEADTEFANQATTTKEGATDGQTACSHAVAVGQQQQQQMDRVRRKAPPPPPRIQQRTVSRYEKDPLNIGVPFPVLTRARPPSASAHAAAADDDEMAEAADLYSNRVDREGLRRAEIHERNVAANTNRLRSPSRVASLPNAEDGLRGIDKSSYDAGSAGQPCDMEGEDDLSVMDARQESFGIPGSFAIRGPGLIEDDLHSSAHLEYSEENAGTDLEQGSSAVELTGNLRSASLCSNTSATLYLSMSSAASDSSYLVEATLVPDEDDKDEDSVVQAEEAEGSLRFSALCVVASFCVMAVIVVGVMVGIAAVFQLKTGDLEYKISEGNRPEQSRSPTVPPSVPTLGPTSTLRDTIARVPTLQRVKETGKLRCGVEAEIQSFLEHVANSQMGQNTTNVTSDANSGEAVPVSRFSYFYCRAIAAAVLGQEANFDFVRVPEKSKYLFLANQSIDLLFSRTPVNMQQDVYEAAALDGLAYSTPNLYTALGFAGVPFYVKCTDANLKTYEECSGIRICANENAFYADYILSSVPQQNLVLGTTSEDTFSNFLMGLCNAIATESPVTVQALLRAFGYTEELALSQKQHSHYELALNSLDSDPEWADFLNAVTMALLSAEGSGITKETADQIGQTALFGVTYQDMFINAIKSGGNFGDIFDFPVPRTGRNMLNNGSSGILASPSLGHEVHSNRRQDGRLSSILERGTLMCGIRGGRPGFAVYNVTTSEWEGLDVSFCKLLAAGLFSGSEEAVDFHDVSDTNGFEELHSGAVDVLAGAVWTLENDFREPVTNVGYSFTKPYFYGPLDDTRFDENLCLATRQDDPEWSAFVYWAAQAVVYAEENNIVMETANEMPLVHVFGPDLQRMFRDVVHYVGNYGALYHRHISAILPRGGRNMLNIWEKDGPLRYIPPGF